MEFSFPSGTVSKELEHRGRSYLAAFRCSQWHPRQIARLPWVLKRTDFVRIEGNELAFSMLVLFSEQFASGRVRLCLHVVRLDAMEAQGGTVASPAAKDQESN